MMKSFSSGQAHVTFYKGNNKEADPNLEFSPHPDDVEVVRSMVEMPLYLYNCGRNIIRGFIWTKDKF